ncbi:MAG TPA: hypothetical protein VIK86_08005 [Candidatus Paceibacterota bacterium]
MINNEYCNSCLKNSVCIWSEKLGKLEGTDKKPCILDITVNECEEYVGTAEDIEVLEETEIDE